MARTPLTVTTVSRNGVTEPSVQALDYANGNVIYDNLGRSWAELINASNASSVNVTFDVPKLFDGDLAIVDLIVALAPGGTKLVGPWKSGVFNQGTDNLQVYFNAGSSGVVARVYKFET